MTGMMHVPGREVQFSPEAGAHKALNARLWSRAPEMPLLMPPCWKRCG